MQKYAKTSILPKNDARIWDRAQMRASKNRKNKQTTSPTDGNVAANATSDKANAN
jgi:hypothetical protein